MDKCEQTAGFLNLRDWYCDTLCVLSWQPACCYLFPRQNSCLILSGVLEPPNWSFFLFTLPLCFCPQVGTRLTCKHLCKSDAERNWQYTISRRRDSCPTRHLQRCIKLSDKFPWYYTVPCLGVGGRMKRQKVCHDKCYAPRNEKAVYVWRKGSKWSLFTRVQVVW